MAKTKLEVRLGALTNAQLTTIYNLVSERQITKFSEHSTAVKRTMLALEKAEKDIIHDPTTGITAVVDAGTRIPRGGKRPGPVPGTAYKNDTRRITVLTEVNPKGKGSKSHKRFELYRTGMTVSEYFAAVQGLGDTRKKASRDMRWDMDHGYISVA